MLQPWQTGKVIRIEQEASQTRRFWIQIPGMESFDFKPGQFVTLDLPIHEKLNKRIRSYSIASWPDGSNIIELVIVLLEGGAGTNYLFNQVTVGSELTLRGPQGIFTLPERIEKDLFFICTGTGIAPFRSMAHHLLTSPVPHRDIYLIFGCRQFGDALYRKELEELSERLEGFHYIPTFSREKSDPANPKLRTGYVHAIYEEICRSHDGAAGAAATLAPGLVTADVGAASGAAGGTIIGGGATRVGSSVGGGAAIAGAPDSGGENGGAPVLRPASFFLCGWKNMIDEAKQRIQALGYDRKSIHQELYG